MGEMKEDRRDGRRVGEMVARGLRESIRTSVPSGLQDQHLMPSRVGSGKG